MTINSRNYGDIESLKYDLNALNNILSRQGTNLLIDVIAEHAGKTANKFNMSDDDRDRLVSNLINDLQNQLNERI